MSTFPGEQPEHIDGKMQIEPGITQCSWFRNCPNDATGVTPHPILGDVPTCDRCAAFCKDDRDPTLDEVGAGDSIALDADYPEWVENPGDTLGPCGCVDYHMADCPILTGGDTGMTKDDYLDMYAGSYPDDWPDDYEGGY